MPAFFKGAVKNRGTGEWEAVPMCAMNQHRWSDLYGERILAAREFGHGLTIPIKPSE